MLVFYKIPSCPLHPIKTTKTDIQDNYNVRRTPKTHFVYFFVINTSTLINQRYI